MQTNVFLDIVGEGELRENIEALIQKYKLKMLSYMVKRQGKNFLNFTYQQIYLSFPLLKKAL